MAGLTSDNISIASARQYGFSKERDTCVFCGKKSRPPPTDPHAPVFAFFSLVDCRHYVCQPCALVNCDNAGRCIRCPTCHAVSRLAQTGKKRTGLDESRVSIDDGVSSVASHTSRRSMRLPDDQRPARSALAKGDRSKKRSSSVQFMPNPATSAVPPLGEGDSHNVSNAPDTSPLTLDAVGRLPTDPSYEQRERSKGKRTEGESKQPAEVNLYTIKGSAAPRQRHSSKRATSVPLPPTEHRYITPPIPFAPPPPLRIRTVDEVEEEEDNEKETTLQQNVNVPLTDIAAEIHESLLASVAKESQERASIAMAEDYRRNAINKQRDIQEKELLAARGRLDDDFEFGLSPRTPVDTSEGQVSSTSDDETPAGQHTKQTGVSPRDGQKGLQMPPALLTTNSDDPHALPTAGIDMQKPEDTGEDDTHGVMDAEQKFAELANRFVRENQQQPGSVPSETTGSRDGSEAPEGHRMGSAAGLEGLSSQPAGLQNLDEAKALDALHGRPSDHSTQLTGECSASFAKEVEELLAIEMDYRAVIEDLERLGWVSLEHDFHSVLNGLFEVQDLRLRERRQVDFTRETITMTAEETTARMWLEQTSLCELTRLQVEALETFADVRRQLQLEEMQRGVSRIVEEQQSHMRLLYDLAVTEDAKRWKLLEEEQRDRHAEWTAFITTMPNCRTSTAVPSSGATSTALQVSSSLCAPELTSAVASTPNLLKSQYLAAVVEEAELGALRLQQTERHERHGLMHVFEAQCQRLKKYETDVETFLDSSITKRAIANSLQRLELREEEKRMEVQQQAWAAFRFIVNKATEEQEQIARMERMLRTIAEQSRNVFNRCFSEVELAMMYDEKNDRQSLEVQERRARASLVREALQREEVLMTEERLSHDVSGMRFLEAMDAAVREFSSKAARIAQEEHLDRLALVQSERLECLSLSHTAESGVHLDTQNMRQQLAGLYSSMEATTAASAWRARLSVLDTEELCVRNTIFNEEAGEWSGCLADERRQRIELTSLEAERLRQGRELERINTKIQECEDVEEQRRLGIKREEARAWFVLWEKEMQDAVKAHRKGEQRLMEKTRRDRHSSHSQRFRRAKEDFVQDEDEERHNVIEDEREARRRLRRQAVQSWCEIMDNNKSEDHGKSGTSMLHHNFEGSPFSNPSSAVYDEEWIRQKRLREAAREEELMEARRRLREAELRIEEEAERRARSEEEKRVALAESERLMREAEGRMEERIRRAREEAERYVEQEMSRVRDANERQAAHAAALRAIEEEEKSAVVEAQLRAAERALKEAERRAAEDLRRVKAEAGQFAAAEAERVALEAKRQLREHQEEHERKLRERDVEVQEKLRDVQRQAQEAVLAAKTKSIYESEAAQQRLEELEARHLERTAAVDAAKESVRAAQQRKRELEESRQSTPQQPSVAAAAAERGTQALTTHVQTLNAMFCSNVIRIAIREAVEEVVKATKEAWTISEGAEQRLRMERRRLRRRQAERDRAEQELIDAENKSMTWGEEDEEGEISKNWVGVGANDETFNTPLNQSAMRRTQKNQEERSQVYARPLPGEGCHVCHHTDTVCPCPECGLQVCLYCGPAVVHSACCEEQHINLVNAHRRHLSGEQQEEEEEQAEMDEERNRADESSVWEVEDSLDIPPVREVQTPSLDVRRQLLPDEQSESKTEDYGTQEGKSDTPKETGKAESIRSLEEPRTERKRYEAFFVPLNDDAEPRRPKPPTPNNYVPGVTTRPRRRWSPPLPVPRSTRRMNSAAEKKAQPSQPRCTRSAPKERPASRTNRTLHCQPSARQTFSSLNRQVKEPLLGCPDARQRRRECGDRFIMQDPLAGIGRTTSPPARFGNNFTGKTTRQPRRMMQRASSLEPSIEREDDFQEAVHRDPTGLERTYYDGRPVQPLDPEYISDDMADMSHRYNTRKQHQERYIPRKLPSREDDRHVNVSRERVYGATCNEFSYCMVTQQRRHESVRSDAHEREESNYHTTPTLHQLDQRLRHLQQHRVFERAYQRTPDKHCMRHHFQKEEEKHCRNAARSSSKRRSTPCSHAPCITVQYFPETFVPPTAAPATQRQKMRGGSSRRTNSRTGKRSTPRVVSPPWRTDFNSEPVRPPWNIMQPHSFIAKSHKRTLLPFEI